MNEQYPKSEGLSANHLLAIGSGKFSRECFEELANTGLDIAIEHYALELCAHYNDGPEYIVDSVRQIAEIAAILGRRGGKIGGKAKSAAKKQASRENGKKGGRPRKK